VENVAEVLEELATRLAFVVEFAQVVITASCAPDAIDAREDDLAKA